MEKKRLFFGLKAWALWPKDFPPERIVPEASRHATLTFLGDVEYAPLKNLLPELPLPSFRIGAVAVADTLLLLPPKKPRVSTWHLEWWSGDTRVISYQAKLARFLSKHGYSSDTRAFLPHITIARQPKKHSAWLETFRPTITTLTDLHLYESQPQMYYTPIWSHKLLPPFTEINHTADIAFLIRGENLYQIAIHAQAALCSHFPECIAHLVNMEGIEGINDIVIRLNKQVAKADASTGCGLKAVSFHGEVKRNEKEQVLHWEMIADV